ncbi:hypothetical protein ACH5RR_041502 [Cinchona calisaya]|uniref:AP2/ERF domain-containing protein n=1 Tax=Cinchona calisaya TaxID=153742 RepID=A0ABD2XX06_9GENT
MDASSTCSDPHPFASPLSDISSQRAVNSDEETIILSSSRPKKRAGRKKFKETRHPIYRGVRRRRWNSNKWVCELREPNKQSRIWLGTYPTPEMAARAYDVAALALRGHFACLNFADSVWRLPLPPSKEAKDIRKAASEGAEMFRPSQEQELLQDCYRSSNTTTDQTTSSVGESGTESEIKKNEISGVSRSCKVVKDEKDEYDDGSKISSSYFVDEEALFDMPGLLTNMAEGLLISPPNCFQDGFGFDDMESNDGEVSLWSYTF